MHQSHVLLAVGLFLPMVAYGLNCTGECQQADTHSLMAVKKVMELKKLERRECHLLQQCPVPTAKRIADTPCQNGKAGEFSCKGVDMLSFVPLADLGSKGEGNDIWGWTDPVTNREYAIMGCTDGASFIDITESTAPVVVGFLPSAQPDFEIWRDIKVYQGHAYVVSEHNDHGMQVVDMTQFRNSTATLGGAVPTLKEDYLYKEFGSCHNIVINEDSGFAYAVGTTTCKGGLHMIDIRDPKKPQFAGCYAEDGYCHDAECVNYHGPDKRYDGSEICFAYNEDSLTVVDVSDKSKPVMLSRVEYEGSAYTHQGWLTADQRYLLLDDELDEVEQKNDGHTQTYMWDASDLTQPRLIASYHAAVRSIDHNLYIIGDIAYMANYESGLRMVNVSNIANGQLNEIAFFDVRPESTDVLFFGSWSVFPWYKSGSVVVSSIERGLFVLKPQMQPNPWH